jgi:phosphatidylinositol N-acetylglucosaminyltransferase subunit Q
MLHRDTTNHIDAVQLIDCMVCGWCGTEFLQLFVGYEHAALLGIATFGLLGGLSLLIAAALDVLTLLTMHVRWFYTGAARIYMHQLRALGTFWRLFRGKKWNVLRLRIDSSDCDIDQLLLGTVLFTVLFFLFPTIAVYYAYFSLLRLALTVVQATLAVLIQVLNHLPVFALVQYAVDRSLFTGMFTPLSGSSAACVAC